MKAAVLILVLSCLCLAQAERTKLWGFDTNVESGRKTLSAAPISGVRQTLSFTFKAEVPIVGIRHLDNADAPVKVKFVKGEINRKEVELSVESEAGHGIDSTFIFYRG